MIVSIFLVISIVWDVVKKDEDGKDLKDENNKYDETKIKVEIEMNFTKQNQID